MSISTELTKRFELSVPVIQAPMAGGGDTAELVAAVCNAGGMGFVGAAYLSPEQIVERGKAVRALTSRPFGINLFAPIAAPPANEAWVKRAVDALRPYYAELQAEQPAEPSAAKFNFDDQLAACLECGAAAFSVAFGLFPPGAVTRIKQRGLFVIGTATTVNEAKALVEGGAEAVVAQGGEAGGHRSTFAGPFEASLVGTMSLVPQVVDAVRVPVIASGGIMDGRGIAAALMLGASAAQMGTAFLTCAESGVPSAYKDAILSAQEDQTQITRAFSGRPARGIVNRVLRDFELNPDAILPFPLQNSMTRAMRTAAAKQNRAEYLSLWAGQGVRMAKRTTGAELVAQLKSELQIAVGRVSGDRR